MNVSLLLSSLFVLLVFTLCGLSVGVKNQGTHEDHGSHLRALWKLHMRNSLLKGPQPVRQHLLYCRVGIGYHLQILPSGLVGGIHNPTEYCSLKVFAMKNGVVGIRGVKSGLYLCLSGEGLAYGTKQFSDDCMLKENLEENYYTTYSSLSHPGIYLALSYKGELRRGNTVSRHQSCTHFLPRKKAAGQWDPWMCPGSDQQFLSSSNCLSTLTSGTHM
ncbi:fibroblast growth factor 4A-like [Parambassis ranga]|uniref:Fibroblast growth factor n=1 Tax=Parambassis ranga TaxID=210632 RepID=A0A6P7KJ24_9TELE|nr:fibroblast growth factor 4A-like [Parambassis ranga]